MNSKHRKRYLAWAVSEARRKLKLRCVAYKGGKCEKCGYSKCPAALQFHHLDPKKKDFGLGGGRTKSWKKVRPELDKTIMVCANCHHEIHYEEDIRSSKKLEEEIRKMVPARKPAEHGGPGRYASGCRCDVCRLAQNKRVRDYRKRSRAGSSEAERRAVNP